MKEPQSILYDKRLKKSMDYALLRKEGISYLQKMSGEIWTDYNEHDPGITILDQFCYALTDVAYRTNIDIEQLLFSEGDYREISENNAFYEPDEIIPCGPATVADYKILLIDRIKEVSNAWVVPVKPSDTKQNVNGLLDVVLKVGNDVGVVNYTEVSKKVKNLFATGFRNLGEDINEIRILEPLTIEVGMNIDIVSDAIGEEVLSDIYYHINAYFNPMVRFYTYEELKHQGADLFDVFETPSFTHGFINKEELQEHKSRVLISQINELIAKVPGVRFVREFVVKKNGIRIHGDTLHIGDDAFVTLKNIQLEEALSADITITKGGVNYEYDPDLCIHLFEMKLAKEKRAYKVKSQRKIKGSKQISLSQLSRFSSIQNTLPGIYGVGRYGLPSDATQERIAQAKQLQGYLFFFDQILSNHLAQLEKIRELFSVKITEESSYFGKLPVDLAGLEDLMDDPSDNTINDLLNASDHFADRKNKIINHLLSRFGERFYSHLSGNLKTLFGNADSDVVKKELLRLKVEFLENYRKISQKRAAGYSYGLPSWDEDNGPMFRKKAYLLLNIKDNRQRSLVDHYEGMKLKVRKPDDIEVLEEKSGGSNGSFKYLKDGGAKFTFLIKNKSTVAYLLRHGLIAENYKLAQWDDKFMILFQVTRQEAPVKICEVNSIDDGKQVIQELTQYFQEISRKAEGFHVVEHILLRSLTLTEYQFQLLDKNDQVLFLSVNDTDLNAQKLNAKDTVLLGCKRSNYKRIQNKKGKHTILIVDRHGNPIARSKNTFASEEGVANKVDDTIRYFKTLDADKNIIDSKMNFEVISKTAAEVDNAFFTSKISIILPDWVARFQSAEFISLLKNAISESIPAHIGTNFLWLSIKKMKEFETVYKEWLEVKREDQADHKVQDKLSRQMIDLLINKT